MMPCPVHPEPVQRRLVPRPVPLRGYAFAIILGIVAAIWISERRWVARGGTRGEISDLAVWAVPFGLVGARLYHVATDPDRYFGAGGSLWEILYVWRGGLGVWGGIAMGAVGVVVGCKVNGIRVAARPRHDGARACWSPRRSAAGATGSTRSSSASPPTCRGAWRSTPTTPRRPATAPGRRSTRRSSTSRCGACAAFAVIVWADRRLAARPRPGARALRHGLHARPRLDREPAHRHRPARRRRGPAPQRVDLDRAVRARHGVVRLRRAPLAGAGGPTSTPSGTPGRTTRLDDASTLLKRRSPGPGPL